MLSSIAICVLMWSVPEVIAWLPYRQGHTSTSIPSPSLQATHGVLPSQSICSYWQFRCNNGQRCIDRYFVCNGWRDCSDNSDEWYWNCRYSAIRPSTTVNVQATQSICSSFYEFRCNSGQCIYYGYRCDGRRHCYDGSDEWYCATQTVCPYWKFRCDNGYECVSEYRLCDGRKDCFDGSDEWYRNCRSSSIKPSSTESVVQSTQSICSPWYEFRCNSGQCIYIGYRCDGRRHCYDGSDEWYCEHSAIRPSSTVNVQATQTVCPYWTFRCDNGYECVPQYRLCDGRRNCFDGSDEWSRNCMTSSINPDPSSIQDNRTICQNKLDLGFILDSSGSVGYNHFQQMKLFVKDVTDFFKLGPDETRVSVMSFSSSAYIHIRFSRNFSDKYQFDSAVDEIRYDDGGTATAIALNMAYNDMFTSRYGARGTEIKKVLVILTDGRSNTGQVNGPARQLRNSGVVIFSVGIGDSFSMQELRVMGSDRVDQHVIALGNFTELEHLAEQMASQTCNASRFQVFCDNDSMTAVFAREDLPKHVNIARLYFRHRSCRAGWNSTHVIGKAPLTGCGTVFSKTEQTLFFTNILSEEGQGRGVGVITRDYLFRANLTCSYPRKRTVGSFSFAPAKQRLFVSLGGQGNFSLSMDVFKTSDYRQPYISRDYPVPKSLSDNLYIQYNINTNNSNLVVRAETCRATPTNQAHDSPQYVFISDGCDRDETIRHYTQGLSRVHRFSIQAFRFLSEHRFVYLHCDLVVCYKYDYNSTCARTTSCSRRYHRDVDRRADDASSMYPLSFGPLMQGKESADKSTEAPSGQVVNTTLVGSLIGFGCLSLILMGALLYMIQRARRRGLARVTLSKTTERISYV